MSFFKITLSKQNIKNKGIYPLTDAAWYTLSAWTYSADCTRWVADATVFDLDVKVTSDFSGGFFTAVYQDLNTYFDMDWIPVIYNNWQLKLTENSS